MEIRFSSLDKNLYNTQDECIDVIRDIFFHAEKGTIICFAGEKQKYHSDTVLCHESSLVYRGGNESTHDFRAGISLFQKKVFTRKNKYLGKVIDMVIDGMFGSLVSITVEKRFFYFFSQRREIFYTWIEEIKKDRIIVREDLLEEKAKTRKTVIETLPA